MVQPSLQADFSLVWDERRAKNTSSPIAQMSLLFIDARAL